MIITVASLNKVKVEAVQEILLEYPRFKDAAIKAAAAASGVADQPRSLEETVQGAINRAQSAYRDCNFSVGLESGLMAVPKTKSGFMDVCVCAIFDGREYHLGLSSAWEAPRSVMDFIKAGSDMNQAAFKAGLTDNPQVGAAEGLVGIMTKGRLTRKQYTKEAIRTALIHLEEV